MAHAHQLSKRQEVQISQAYKDIAQHFQFYELKSGIEYFPNLHKTKNHSFETFSYYVQNHTLFEIKNFDLLRPFLRSIQEYDKIFKLENRYMLFHSYILLHFIHQHLFLLAVYEEESFKERTFASLKGDRMKNLARHNKYKRDIFRYDTLYKGDKLIHSYISRLYFLHPTAMEMFMNMNTLIPQHQCKELQADTKENKMIKQLLKYYGSTNITSSSVILKSLMLVIASYLKFKMKMKHKNIQNSLEKLFYDFIYPYSDEEYYFPIPTIRNHIFNNVYIKGRLDMQPLFGSSEKGLDNVSDIQKLDWLFEDAAKEFGISLEIPIDGDTHPIRNPLSIYLSNKPIELLQQTR